MHPKLGDIDRCTRVGASERASEDAEDVWRSSMCNEEECAQNFEGKEPYR